MNLIKQLKQHDIIKYGEFILKCGAKSNIYVDFKSVISYPSLMSDIAFELSKLIIHNGVLCGVPQGGLSYTTLISHIKNMPMILVRNEKKDYGTCQQIEGNTFNNEIILIEDVITTGSSVLNIIKILEQNGMIIKQIICILDREAGGVAELKQNYNVTSLLTLTQCLNYIEPKNELIISNLITEKLLMIIRKKKTNLIVSLDCDIKDLFDIIQLIGDHVCAIKIHFDIYNIYSQCFAEDINKLKQEKEFLVIEDRKFADIAHISLKQLDIVQSFADIITVHGICGESLIKELNNRNIGLLPVHMLSLENNLIDRTYSNKLLNICRKYNNVVGFVSQEKIDGYLTFSPGIKLVSGAPPKAVSFHSAHDMRIHAPNANETAERRCTGSDGMGQQYKSVDSHNADIFIVGRGIYESENILETTIEYRNACFSKWKN